MALGKHYGAFGAGFAKSFMEMYKLSLMRDMYASREAYNAARAKHYADMDTNKDKGGIGSPSLNREIAAGRAGWGTGGASGGAPPSGSDFERVKAALTGTESGGNYNAVNSRTGATGRYQVMPFNIGPWTQKYLGQTMTQQEFRNSPEAQDKVFEGEMNAQYQKYGNWRDVVSVWHSGVPYDQAVRENRNDGNMSTQHYTDSILARASVAPASTPTTAPTTAPTSPPTTTAANTGPNNIYANIPAKDSQGRDQLPMFNRWNPDPVGNEASNLKQINPDMQKVIARARADNPDLNFVLGNGKRSAADQDWAKSVGWSKVGSKDGGDASVHMKGNAADLWALDDQGRVTFDPGAQAKVTAAIKKAAQETGVKLNAGDDWRHPDKPHFELATPSTTTASKGAPPKAAAAKATSTQASRTPEGPPVLHDAANVASRDDSYQVAGPAEALTPEQAARAKADLEAHRAPVDTRTAAEMDQDSPAPPPGSAPPRNERALAPPQVAPPPPRPGDKIDQIPPGPVPAQDAPIPPTQAVRPEAPMATPLQAVRPEAPIPWSPQPIVNAARPDAPVDTRGVLPVAGARPDQPLPTRGVIAPSGARPDAPVSTTGLPPAPAASEPVGTQFARPAPPAAPMMPPRTTTPATAYPPGTIYGPSPRADTGARPDLTARSPDSSTSSGAIPSTATANVPPTNPAGNSPGFVQVTAPNSDPTARNRPQMTALDLSHLWGPNPPLSQQTPGSSPGAAPTSAPTPNKNDFDVPPTPDFSGMTDEMVMGSAKGGPIQSSGAAANTRRSMRYARGGAIPTRPTMKLAMGGGADSYTPYTPGPAVSSNSAVSGFTYNPAYSVGENLQQEKNQLLYGTTTPGASADFGAAWGKLTPAQQNWMTQASTVNTAAPYGSMEYNQLNANPISTPAPAPTPAAPAPAPAPAPVITPPTATNITAPAATTTITDPTTTTTTGAPGLPNSIQAKSYDPNVDQQTGAGFANTSNVGGTDYSVGTDDLLQQNSKGQISGTNQNNTTILSRKGGPIPQSRRRPTLHLPTRVKFDDGGGVSPSFAGMPPGLGGQQAIPPIYFNPATYAGMGAPVGKGITNTSAPTFSAGAIPSLPMARGGRVGFAAGGGVAPRADASYTRIGYDDGGDVGMEDLTPTTASMDNEDYRNDAEDAQRDQAAAAKEAADNAPVTSLDQPGRPNDWYVSAAPSSQAGGAGSPTSSDNTPPADPIAPQIKDDQGNPSKGLIAAIGDGLHWLGAHLGLVGGAQAAPLAPDAQTQTNRQQHVNYGPDTATYISPQNVEELNDVADPNHQLQDAYRNIAGLEQGYKWALSRGDDATASRLAASILHSSVIASQQLSDKAATALRSGDLQKTVDYINDASDAIPDGRLVHATLSPDGKTVQIQGKDLNGNVQWQQTGAAQAVLERATSLGRSGKLQWDALESQAAKYDSTFANMQANRRKNQYDQGQADQIAAANAKFAPAPRPVTPRVTAPALPGPGAAPATTTASAAPAQPAQPATGGPATGGPALTPPAISASPLLQVQRGERAAPTVDTQTAGATPAPAPSVGASGGPGIQPGPTREAAAATPNPADMPSSGAQEVAALSPEAENAQRAAITADVQGRYRSPEGYPVINNQVYAPPDQSLIKTPADQIAYNNAMKTYQDAEKYVGAQANAEIQARNKDLTDTLNVRRQALAASQADTRAAARERATQGRLDQREQFTQDQTNTRAQNQMKFDAWKEGETRKYANVKPLDDQQLRPEIDTSQGGTAFNDTLASALAPPDVAEAVKQGRVPADQALGQTYSKPDLNTIGQAVWNARRYTHDTTIPAAAELVGGMLNGTYKVQPPEPMGDVGDGVARTKLTIMRPNGTAQTLILPEQDARNLNALGAARAQVRQAAIDKQTKYDADRTRAAASGKIITDKNVNVNPFTGKVVTPQDVTIGPRVSQPGVGALPPGPTGYLFRKKPQPIQSVQ